MSKCKVFFQYPIMSIEEEKKFYDKEFAEYQKKRGSENELNMKQLLESKTAEIKRREKLVKNIIKSKKEILEIGCGNGFFINYLKENYNSVVAGVEPQNCYSDFAKKKLNLNVYSDINKLKNQKFDLILSYYVFEHLRNPIKYIKNLFSLLKNKGQLIFEVPNGEEALLKLYNCEEYKKFCYQKAHYLYFTLDTFKYIFSKKKANIIQLKTVQRYPIYNHLKWLTGIMDEKYFKNYFSEKLSKKYKKELSNQNIGDTIFGIIEKR